MRRSLMLLTTLFLIFGWFAPIMQAQQRMTIQATARGTGTQMGKMVNVKILIEGFSTLDDRKTLIDAFKRSGQDGLRRALEDMKGKGRFSSDYGVGNQVKYIIELPSENGQRHLRLITDRRLAFGELYGGTRSSDYDVGAIDLFLTPDGKGSGTILPACKITINKKKQQLEVETFQNPWKLNNFIISNG